MSTDNRQSSASNLVEISQHHHYLNQQERWESNARSYPRKFPICIAKAQGIYVTDAQGKTFIDCLGGAGTLALGHNHPLVIEAVEQVLRSGQPLHTLDLMSPTKATFIDEVLDSLPAGLADNVKIQFCGPSGADAVEAAIKLAKTATGRGTMLSFHGAYHGMTHATLAVSGNKEPKDPVRNLMADVHFLPYPHAYRCPFGVGGEQGERLSINYIKHVLDDSHSGISAPAGVILEAVQGEGGVIPCPDNWLNQLSALTRQRQIPLMLDEVQAGIGRTGKMFAFEHADILPDIIIASKAIGGGLPMSLVIYKQELDRWTPGAHTGTFRGNVLAMAAGTATLRYLKQDGFLEHVTRQGQNLLGHCRQLQQHCDIIGDVRGRGLMVGVEIVDPRGETDMQGHSPASGVLARQVQQACFDRGLIIELGGRADATMRFLPPLIISEQEIAEVCDIFAAAVMEVTVQYDRQAVVCG
jgi:diaminobutyrate-2-oxoglutarate transaminase